MKSLRNTSAGIFFLAFLSFSSFAKEGASKLDVTLAKAPSTPNSDAGSIVVTITNVSKEPLFLPRWKTPIYSDTYRKLYGYIFDIVDENGDKAKFIGDFVDVRPTNIERSTWRIEPGQSVNQEVNLASYYDLKRGGTFKISYEQKFLRDPYINSEGYVDGRWDDVKSNTLALWVSASLAEAASQATAIGTFSNFPDFPGAGCGIHQITPALQAMLTAGSWASKASGHLGNLYFVKKIAIKDEEGNEVDAKYKPIMREDFKYTLWFGAQKNKDDDNLYYQDVYDSPPLIEDIWDKTDFFPIKEFQAIKSRSVSGKTSYRCGCDNPDPMVAAVAKTSNPYLVDLCDHFFELSAETQAQTFVHEWAHFGDNYAEHLLDHTNNGPYNARELAKSDRDKAVKNADSAGYFAQDVARHDSE